VIEVHHGPVRFRYGLTGSSVDARHARCLTGLWLDEAHAGSGSGGGGALLDDYHGVLTTRGATWRRGPPRMPSRPPVAAIEVLRLPLARDRRLIDTILEIALYFDARGRET